MSELYSKDLQQRYIRESKSWQKSVPSIFDIEALREVLKYHEWRYYINNDPVISDTEYDIIYKKLEKLEIDHPQSITADSPTQRVSSDLSGDFAAIRHLTPMLSLGNSYNAEDLLKWDEQVHKHAGFEIQEPIEYCLEPKYDGGSVAIVYENNLLARAATRGNGIEGEDITLNARTLPSLPLSTAWSKYGIATAEIRGEAVIRKDRFVKTNKNRAAAGKSLFANPRNSATGGLRMKNPNETKERGLEVFSFQLGYAQDTEGNDQLKTINTHSEQIALLGSLGFKIEDPTALVCKNIQEVISNIQEWDAKREAYPYEIDGMVVKVNSRELQEKCGYTSHHPRWAIAYKFKAKQATTTLEHIEYQVGKVGSIAPVAKVTPVHLAGVTVSSISLHNEDFIISKDLRIGDQIIIERAGDVIPYIVKSLADIRTGAEEIVKFPTHCPIDSQHRPMLEKAEGESAWRCPKCVCGAQDLQRIIFHVSKVAMDIDGFGKSYVERFYDEGWIKDISDVYNLEYSEISKLEGLGQKSADNLQASIEKAKQNPISKLLHSLSVHHLGKRASQLIGQEIESVFDLQNWTEEQYLEIKDIGPVVAKNVSEYFQDKDSIAMLRRMEERGVNMLQTEDDKPLQVAEDAPFSGKTILFTGSLQLMTRKQAQELAAKSGAKNISAVSSNLNILVAGEKAGSKLKKATALGTVEIWSEEEFIERVGA
ncbi:MAG: DNA ligase (NAD+) [Saprospiraceae bacterium]|jgi:DNA ligase (NAD+)